MKFFNSKLKNIYIFFAFNFSDFKKFLKKAFGKS